MRSSTLNHRKTFSRGFPQMHSEIEDLIKSIEKQDKQLFDYIIDNSEGLGDVFFFGVFTSMLLTFCIYEVDVQSCEDFCEKHNRQLPSNLRLLILRRLGDLFTRIFTRGRPFIIEFILRMIKHHRAQILEMDYFELGNYLKRGMVV